MARIATYVFVDLETTGLPAEELNKTRIIELSMVAVKRTHILDTRPGSVPRVQHKITMCFNPRKFVCVNGTKVHGLCNDLLENEPVFNLDVFNMIDTFLKVLSKPVCLVAQNGHAFDFPILKNHLEKLKVSFPEDLLCADCYHAFYDILEMKKKIIMNNIEETKLPADTGDSYQDLGDVVDKPKELNNVPSSSKTIDEFDDVDFFKTNERMQAINETTPKQRKSNGVVKRPSKACRRLPWGNGPKPKESYKLSQIYERVLNKPAEDAHRAENDCLLALGVSAALAKKFVEWMDENNVKFSEVIPMTIGEKLGSKFY